MTPGKEWVIITHCKLWYKFRSTFWIPEYNFIIHYTYNESSQIYKINEQWSSQCLYDHTENNSCKMFWEMLNGDPQTKQLILWSIQWENIKTFLAPFSHVFTWINTLIKLLPNSIFALIFRHPLTDTCNNLDLQMYVLKLVLYWGLTQQICNDKLMCWHWLYSWVHTVCTCVLPTRTVSHTWNMYLELKLQSYPGVWGVNETKWTRLPIKLSYQLPSSGFEHVL